MYILFGAVFDDGEVSMADLFANLVLDAQLRRLDDQRLTVTAVCTSQTSSFH